MLLLFQATLSSFPSIKENLAFFQTLAVFISSCPWPSEAKAAHSCACLHQLARDSSTTVWTLEAVVPRELFISFQTKGCCYHPHRHYLLICI